METDRHALSRRAVSRRGSQIVNEEWRRRVQSEEWEHLLEGGYGQSYIPLLNRLNLLRKPPCWWAGIWPRSPKRRFRQIGQLTSSPSRAGTKKGDVSGPAPAAGAKLRFSPSGNDRSKRAKSSALSTICERNVSRHPRTRLNRSRPDSNVSCTANHSYGSSGNCLGGRVKRVEHPDLCFG
jgi:hypothetical protein